MADVLNPKRAQKLNWALCQETIVQTFVKLNPIQAIGNLAFGTHHARLSPSPWLQFKKLALLTVRRSADR